MSASFVLDADTLASLKAKELQNVLEKLNTGGTLTKREWDILHAHSHKQAPPSAAAPFPSGTPAFSTSAAASPTPALLSLPPLAMPEAPLFAEAMVHAARSIVALKKARFDRAPANTLRPSKNSSTSKATPAKPAPLMTCRASACVTSWTPSMPASPASSARR